MTRVYRSEDFKQFFLAAKPYAIFFLGMYLYALAIDFRNGIDSSLFFLQWIELLFLIYFYAYFYNILKPARWRHLYAAIPIFVTYLIQDIYYLVYGKIFRLVNVLEVPELLQVVPVSYIVTMLAFFVLPFILFFTKINYRNIKTITAGALPLCILAGLILISPNSYTKFVQTAGNEIALWSDAESVENNGRYTMLFYREAKRQIALSMTKDYRDRERYEKEINLKASKLNQNNNRRNVHFIVLESLLDPRLFKEVAFSKDPAHPEFDDLFKDKLGLSIAPVFGGGTAQCEFEVLCGIPAMEELTSIEFNIFTGSPVYCLPGILNKLGYRTLATNAYKPNYFNAVPAYRGIGFSEIYHPREYSLVGNSYFSIGDAEEEDEYYIFDGKLFDQNLAFVAKSLEENSTIPIFNYVMTSYGHTPPTINIIERPVVILSRSSYSDDHLQLTANQFFYRTQAIAKYVKDLIKLDKNSLIILVSDHLPPLENGTQAYEELRYMGNIENAIYYNRLMIIENGRPVVYKDLSHYDLADLVYNYITDGQHCSEKACAFLDGNGSQERWSFLDEYLKLMAHASESKVID